MSHAPRAALERRHASVRNVLAASGLDALVVTALPNITYLSNFVGSSAVVLLTRERFVFITDFRYVTAVEPLSAGPNACPGLELLVVDSSYDATLVSALRQLRHARIGIEAAHLTVARYRWLDTALGGGSDCPELVDTADVVERVRLVKDAYELDTLREAGRRLSAVAREVVRSARVGLTERELAHAIDARLLAAGFERPAFDTIVAAGPNSALPHARPSERKLDEGDLVVLDFGGVYDSYCVDLTRTVSIGPASARAREVHAAVLEAHDRAIAVVRPGASAFDIDGAARDTLATHGMAEAFGHGTGHGLGLEVHEAPRVSRRRAQDPETDPVTPGMVFTIEPGAYFPGWGGVRIEDDVVVTADGVEMLTDVPTDLIDV